MSSIATLPSLVVLQASFASRLAGISPELSSLALAGLRQVRAFSGLSGLSDLISQDNLARLIFKPSLFQEAAVRLNAFHDLDDLRAIMGLASIKERLGACAQAIDLRHGVQIYGAMMVFNDELDALESLGKTMSRALKDELNWPHTLTLETLGGFAASVRRTFDMRSDHLTAEQRHDLMQTAARLNEASANLCAFDPAEAISPIQARKIGTLIEVLYGCGFGDDRWQGIADALHRLTRNWGKFDVTTRTEELQRSARLAGDMLEEVKTSYRNLFDPIGGTPDLKLAGATAPLGRHLDSLNHST
ncbi:MAG TPA: hypothetical protein VLJ37_07690 [bacterium]|nr:hypothetical protein [bacterium]